VDLEGELECSIQAELAQATGETIRVRSVAGFPAREIARFAHSDDILVSGTHARTAAGWLFMGSVTRKLLRRAPCPVLVVGADRSEPS
jgi:nucleotide-binding universal stress UspA family protein